MRLAQQDRNPFRTLGDIDACSCHFAQASGSELQHDSLWLIHQKSFPTMAGRERRKKADRGPVNCQTVVTDDRLDRWDRSGQITLPVASPCNLDSRNSPKTGIRPICLAGLCVTPWAFRTVDNSEQSVSIPFSPLDKKRVPNDRRAKQLKPEAASSSVSIRRRHLSQGHRALQALARPFVRKNLARQKTCPKMTWTSHLVCRGDIAVW